MYVVVTADNFGSSFAHSCAMVDAHRAGVVTAVSVSVLSGDEVRKSVDLLADCPNLDVGLHLTLSRCGCKPIMARESSGLIDPMGEFHTPRHLLLQAMRGKLNLNALAEEIVAQAAKFQELLGRPPTHVDSLEHVHQLPVVREALLEAIGHGLLPPITRTTVQIARPALTPVSTLLRRRFLHRLGRKMNKTLSERWIWKNDRFLELPLSSAGKMDRTVERLFKLLPSDIVVELSVAEGSSQLSQLDAFRPHLSRKSVLARRQDSAA